jgi:sugar phosphate isomerase/epimerase
MKEWIISVSTIAFRGFDFPTIVEALAAIGIKYVEFAFIKGYTKDLTESDFTSSKARFLRQLLEAHDLKTIALSAHMDLGQADAVDAFKSRMDFAKELGVEIIISNSSIQSRRDAFFRNMDQIARYAESADIGIGLENPGDGRENLIGCGRDGELVVKAINSPRVQLNYDFCNTFSYSKGLILPEEDMHHAAAHSIYCHLKDMQPDEGGWIFPAIGKGVINYRHILAILKNQSAPIPIGLELPLAIRRDKSFNPGEKAVVPTLAEIKTIVKESFEYTRRQLLGEAE